MRILVVTTTYPPTDANHLLTKAVDGLLGREHTVSILAAGGDGTNDDHRPAIRRQLTTGLLRGPRNYFISREVCTVAMPDLCLAWDCADVTASAVAAAVHYGAPVAWCLTNQMRDMAFRGLSLSSSFAVDTDSRSSVSAKLSAVKDAPIFGPDEITACGDGFHTWLCQVRLKERFERYEDISRYKQNPRPYMHADA